MHTATNIAKTVGMDASKIVSKRIVQITAEAIGDLIRIRITDKITSVDKPKTKGKEKHNLNNGM